MNQKTAGVLGAGGWGVALANLLCAKGHAVRLWEFDSRAADNLRVRRALPKKLPGITLSSDILVTNDITEATDDADFICLVVPSQTMRSVGQLLNKSNLSKRPILVNLSKGIEVGTLKRMSEVLRETVDPGNYGGIGTLSGPSHAEEVARNIPTAVVAASESEQAAAAVQELFITPRFRVYTTTDILGVELAGSLKNIVALAAGMLDGLGMGDNTRGALLTRGLAEIARMGKKLGADPLTFSGLSGVGDLVTTCLSRHSRNRFVGEQIGLGRKLDAVLSHMTMVAEGVETTRSGYALSAKHDIEMPITAQVYKVLFEGKSPLEAINDLMVRDPKAESMR
ncbi:MAG: glycerol-3-phosphate dehydrogenase [candidate division Zixibacteria bacterium RBG_16_53_22]|nr:MAG: glycerol-3-phosphate dehydrogenase [candidate division Zixibacteria bacterium RBG_16_53_22]